MAIIFLIIAVAAIYGKNVHSLMCDLVFALNCKYPAYNFLDAYCFKGFDKYAAMGIIIPESLIIRIYGKVLSQSIVFHLGYLW